MSGTRKNILIINYSFPPYPGVGGRRWAKFSKYLAKEGFGVHVICSRNQYDYSSNYLKDIDFDGIFLHPLPPKYPKVLFEEAKTISSKLWYRIVLAFFKIRTEGNYNDRAILWKKQLHAKVSSLIEEYKIEDVIITGAPFSLLYYCLDLKQKYAGRLRLHGDMRDPWTWGNGYGMQHISAKRKAFEVQMEKEVIENFETIFLPVTPMQDHLKQTYPGESEKFILLPHAYDAEEMDAHIFEAKASTGDKTKLLLYGTLYNHLEKEMHSIASFIKKNPAIQLDIYTDVFSYSKIFKDFGLTDKQVFYHHALPVKDLYVRIRESNYVLMVHPFDPPSNGISTKFFEIVNLKVPILFLGYDECVQEFLEKEELGIYITPELLETIGSRLKEFNYNKNFDVKNFSFQQVTKSILMNYIKL